MKEFLTVGELAKQMNITVRTLQYYDNINLLKPTRISEAGRRLYTNKDMLRLHQILSLKYLGFSLEDIQSRLLNLDTPQEVLELLKNQISSTKEKIEDYQKALMTMEKMSVEIQNTSTVDFNKYADIISLIRNNCEHYWVLNCFDDKVIDHLRNEFKDDPERGMNIFYTYEKMVEVTLSLQEKGIAPDSEEAITMAKDWWAMVMEFTNGDMTLLKHLEAFNQTKDRWDKSMAQKQEKIDHYVEQALEAYFKKQESRE